MSKTNFTLEDEALDAQGQNVTPCWPPYVTPCYPPCYVSDEALDAQG